jgi:hypothetical protein
LAVNSADFIERHLAALSLEGEWGASRIGTLDSGHWGDKDCSQVSVHLVWRNHEAGARFPHF